MTISSVRTSCATVAHELNGARYRCAYLARVPETLLNEIIQQGHSRETAKLFAALIGEMPRRKSDRSIVIRRHGGVIAILKPLKFLESAGFVLDRSDLSVAFQSE